MESHRPRRRCPVKSLPAERHSVSPLTAGFALVGEGQLPPANRCVAPQYAGPSLAGVVGIPPLANAIFVLLDGVSVGHTTHLGTPFRHEQAYRAGLSNVIATDAAPSKSYCPLFVGSGKVN